MRQHTTTTVHMQMRLTICMCTATDRPIPCAVCAWIAKIALADQALSSRHCVGKLDGVGAKCLEHLKRAEEGKPDYRPPKRGKYCSAAAAMLVALLEHEEREAEQGVLVTKGQLIEAAEKLCTEQRFKPLDAHVRAKGEEGGARCPAFQQMAELMNDGLVKYRARKHACASGDAY